MSLCTCRGESGDPVAILMAASVVRDEMPWLYELAMEAYGAVKAGDVESIEREMKRISRFSGSSLGKWEQGPRTRCLQC